MKTSRLNYLALGILAVTVLLCFTCGCTYTKFTDPKGASFSRISVLNSQSVGKVEVKANEHGVTSVELEGYKSEQTQLAGAIAEGVAKAIKP